MKNILACDSGCAHERDKGWAWVIAGAAFVASGATFGIWKTLILFFNDWSSEWNEEPGRVACVQSISFAMLTCASPIAGFSVRTFGSRPTVMLGGFLAATGAGLSYYAQSLNQLYIFIGGITHFGICLTYLPSFISLGIWMEKRRSLANSIAEMGGPLIAFALPLIFQPLRDAIGWRHTMLIAAAIYLTIVISGILQKPFEQTEKSCLQTNCLRRKNSKQEKLDMENNVEEKSDFINEKTEVPVEAPLPIYRRPAVCGKIIFYMIYCLFQFGGLFALNIFITPYATKDRGFSEERAAYLLSVNAALDLIGRPLSGAILSLPLFSERRIELIALFMALYGFVCFLFRFAHSYYFFAALYGAAGLLFGFWNGTYWTVIPDIFGEELFPIAASCGMMMGGVALLLTAPIAGSLVETSVGYDGVAYQSSVQLFIAAFLLFLLKRNYPCCKIELPTGEGANEEGIAIGESRVGEKLATIPLNTEREVKDFLSVDELKTPNGAAMKRKTYSVVELALSMSPATSIMSVNSRSDNPRRRAYSLSKSASVDLRPHFGPSLEVPTPLDQTTRSVTSLRGPMNL